MFKKGGIICKRKKKCIITKRKRKHRAVSEAEAKRAAARMAAQNPNANIMEDTAVTDIITVKVTARAVAAAVTDITVWDGAECRILAVIAPGTKWECVDRCL